MPNIGEQKCIDGNVMTWHPAADDGSGGDDGGGEEPVDTLTTLQAILASLQNIEANSYDNSFTPPSGGNYPYDVYNLEVLPSTVQLEQELYPAARSIIFISDQALLLNLYDRTAPPWSIQAQSGTTDYLLKQVSLWSLPRSWAIPKVYISNTSTSATAKVQIITWG